jgi:hypothetical protein
MILLLAPVPRSRRCPHDDRKALVCLAPGLRTGASPTSAPQRVTHIVTLPPGDLPHLSFAPPPSPPPRPPPPPPLPLFP